MYWLLWLSVNFPPIQCIIRTRKEILEKFRNNNFFCGYRAFLTRMAKRHFGRIWSRWRGYGQIA